MVKKAQNKAKSKSSLANLLKDITTPAPKDVDPEDVHFRDSSISKGNEEDSEDSEGYGSEAGREHYFEVGKSQLRSQLNLPIADDPKYRGSKSSRSAIYDESDVEESEVEDGESDIEDSEVENNEEVSGVESSQHSVVEDEGLSENSEGELDSSAESELDSPVGSDDELKDQNSLTAELREAEEEEKKLLSELAKKATTDATKGHYVKKQLSLWESTLDLRIRFQKLVTLTYPLPQNNEHLREALLNTDSELINSTSSKIVNLIGNLLDVRQSLWPKSSDDPSLPLPKPVILSSKRPRDADLDEIWKDISKVSESSTNYYKNTLEKWSNKVRMSEGSLLKGKKFKAIDQTFLNQVQSALADKDRILRRSQLKRTDYKVIGQSESKSTEDDGNLDPEIYDDGDFYQQLLREFIESRMVDNDNQAELGGLRWAALKKDKQPKTKSVDTRASKGRKLRYHVHEPLQSFMAPVPTQMWHSEMIDELYSSLFQTSALVSKKPVDDCEIPNDGLRIFG